MYNVHYFIKKFEAIPEELWFVGDFNGPNNSKCAFGHCNMSKYSLMSNFPEAVSLNKLKNDIVEINDGGHPDYQQPTPKQRILAALYDIKKLQQPQHVDITKELAVLPVNETSDLITTNILGNYISIKLQRVNGGLL